jgi:tetratricopeptide (TPR) repeat protein
MATRENREAVMLLRSIPAEAVGAEDRRLLALAEYRMGDFEAAKRSIAQAIAMSSEVSYPALHLKARIHHDAEEWLLAFNTFKQIMDAEVELSAEEQLMAARTLYERRRRAAGKAMLLILLAGDDTPPHAAVEYAQREGSDDPLGAMLHLVAAQERAPENFALLQEMTLIDRRRGAKNTGLNQALKRVDSAVERGEGGIRTLLLRAEILADLGELERAENDALRAFEAAPSMPGAVDLLVQIYRKQDKIAEARKSFEEAEQAGVLHAGARRLLARLYAEQGDHADALRVLEEVLEESPDMVGATRDLARILASEGSDPERALESARSANDRQKHNPRSAATLAFVYFRSELYEDALREYQRSLRLDRTSGRRMTPSLLYNLGLTLQKLDQNEKAARAFESALAISDDFPEAVEARRQLYKTSR